MNVVLDIVIQYLSVVTYDILYYYNVINKLYYRLNKFHKVDHGDGFFVKYNRKENICTIRFLNNIWHVRLIYELKLNYTRVLFLFNFKDLES